VKEAEYVPFHPARRVEASVVEREAEGLHFEGRSYGADPPGSKPFCGLGSRAGSPARFPTYFILRTCARFVIGLIRWYSSSPCSNGLAKGEDTQERTRVLRVRSSAPKNNVLLRVLRRRLHLADRSTPGQLDKPRRPRGSRARFKDSESHLALTPSWAGSSSGGAIPTVRSGCRARAPSLLLPASGGTLLHPLGRHDERRATCGFSSARDRRQHHVARSRSCRPAGALPMKRTSGTDHRVLLVLPPAPA
jgi:hypothetical protein